MRGTWRHRSAVLVAIALASAGCSQATHATHSTPAPSAAPTTSRPSRPSAARIVARGLLISMAGSPRGVVTVWSLCHRDSCHAVWQLHTARHTWRGVAHGPTPTAYLAGRSFVVSSWDRLGVVIHRDGTTTPLHRVRRVNDRPDALIGTGKGLAPVAVADASVGRLPALTGYDGLDNAVITPGGAVVALAFRAGPSKVVAVRLDGAAPTMHTFDKGNAPGPVVGSGDRVAVLASYDGATDLPVGTLGVSTDGGRDWTALHAGDVPFKVVDNMATTSTGTLEVGTPYGSIYRSTNRTWTSFARVRSRRLFLMGSYGARVLAESAHHGFYTVDQHGRVRRISLR